MLGLVLACAFSSEGAVGGVTVLPDIGGLTSGSTAPWLS